MADYTEQANVPIKIEIAGKKFKAKRPDLNSLYGAMEAELIADEIAKVKQAADEFGLEGQERMQFLREGFRDVPRGEALQLFTWSKMGTPDGVARVLFACLKDNHPDVTMEMLQKIIVEDTEMATQWATYLSGATKKVPGTEEDEKTETTPSNPLTGDKSSPSLEESTDGPPTSSAN